MPQAYRARVGSRPILIRRQRPLRLRVGRILRRQSHDLAADILHGAVLHLVVLSLGVELDAGSDAGIVGDVGGADRVGQRLGVGRTGTLVGIGGDQQRLEGEDVVGVEIDAGVGLGQRRFEDRRQLLVRVVPGNEADRAVDSLPSVFRY